MPTDDTFTIPNITAEMLSDYAAETLAHASGMWKAVQEQTKTDDEAVSILNDTLIEHFKQMVQQAQLLREGAASLSSKQDAELNDSMNLHIANIAAAALALRPVYDAAAKVSAKRVTAVTLPN